MNSNHTQISTTNNNNNDNPSYADFMLSSHLKVPMLSSTPSSYQENNNKKSPEQSPTKQNKTSKKSLNNTFKNQFSSNSLLLNW